MKNYIKLKERKDIVLIIKNLTYIDTLELIQKINSTDNIIYISLTHCGFGDYSINQIPKVIICNYITHKITQTTWIIGTENHSIMNGTIVFQNNKFTIEYYERIKKPSAIYYFR